MNNNAGSTPALRAIDPASGILLDYLAIVTKDDNPEGFREELTYTQRHILRNYYMTAIRATIRDHIPNWTIV